MTLADDSPEHYLIGQITAEAWSFEHGSQLRIATALRDYYEDRARRVDGMANGLLTENAQRAANDMNATIARLSKGAQ